MAWWETKTQAVGKQPTRHNRDARDPRRSRLVSPSQGTSFVAKQTKLQTTLCLLQLPLPWGVVLLRLLTEELG